MSTQHGVGRGGNVDMGRAVKWLLEGAVVAIIALEARDEVRSFRHRIASRPGRWLTAAEQRTRRRSLVSDVTVLAARLGSMRSPRASR